MEAGHGPAARRVAPTTGRPDPPPSNRRNRPPIDIRFRDRCHESIPDADFDAGRAVNVDGVNLHVACALKRSAARGGPRAWLTFALALYAAGVTTYLLLGSGVLRRDSDVPSAVEARVRT